MSLIAHYKNVYDGVDAIGSYSGTPTDVTAVTGKIGLAGSFNGTSSKIVLPDSTAFDFGDGTNDSPFSFVCWIYWNAAALSPILMRTYASGDTQQHQYAYRITAAGQLGMYVMANGLNNYRGRLSANGAIAIGAWRHIGFTYDGRGGTAAHDGIILYADGVRVDNANSTAGTYTAMGDSTAVPEIGHRYNGGDQWTNALFDDVRIYNEALAVWQIKAIYNHGLGTEKYDPWRKSFGGIYLRGAA